MPFLFLGGAGGQVLLSAIPDTIPCHAIGTRASCGRRCGVHANMQVLFSTSHIAFLTSRDSRYLVLVIPERRTFFSGASWSLSPSLRIH